MKRLGIAVLALIAATLGAFGQANNSSTWQTPGNQTVPGHVLMGVNAAGIAVPNLAGAAGYPPGVTPITAVFTGADTASATATLAATAGVTNYICGFNITGLGATAATIVSPTLSGVESGNTFTYTGAFTFSLGAAVADAPVSFTFSPCQAANAVNTAIVVTVPGAAGNTNLSINVSGYRG